MHHDHVHLVQHSWLLTCAGDCQSKRRHSEGPKGSAHHSHCWFAKGQAEGLKGHLVVEQQPWLTASKLLQGNLDLLQGTEAAFCTCLYCLNWFASRACLFLQVLRAELDPQLDQACHYSLILSSSLKSYCEDNVCCSAALTLQSVHLDVHDTPHSSSLSLNTDKWL